MIPTLRVFAVVVLVTMLAITTLATLERGIFEAIEALWPDLWFRATLADAYFAFLTVWLWMAYKEPTWLRRIVWLLLVLCLGNFAIATYLLIQLSRLRPGDGPERLLLKS